MSTFSPFRTAAFALLVAVLALAARSALAAPAAVSYYDDIKPLLAVHCYKCHSEETTKGGLRLDVRAGAFGKGKSGAVAVLPGEAGRSEVVRRITSHDPDEVMPKEGLRLTPEEVERVRAWIDQGARWPERDDYWAFQPPKAPTIPATKLTSSANPIDAFIAARLESAQITPTPPADARMLLRRAYADLLGVPPSPEEADAFLKDHSPDAYERLIDRLLADPRYGERWARHWLDLVRYAESDGFEDDKVRPHAWRYRDYVIRSLNADKPYDRFVREQIAGDELYGDDPDAWVATGFARLGMWDGMSKDPPRQRQDFLNDITDAVGSVFLGMTVGCARCHDHKYDPIAQADYYSLQAFFAGVRRDVRDFGNAVHDSPHVVAAHEKAEAELARVRGERESVLRDAREAVRWDRRCEVDEQGQLKITDSEVRRRADVLRPGRVASLDGEIKRWDSAERLNRPAAEVAYEDSTSAPKTVLLKGGELSRPGPEGSPRFIPIMTAEGGADPHITPPPGGHSTGRRAALADWFASPTNPLVARVIVNRLWQHHFGRGIVATPSDFGRHGKRPTHPELLDWLAVEFMNPSVPALSERSESKWSLKRMHRLMMTSDAYRRASTFDSAAADRDPGNALLWRQNRRRLEGEAVRDAMLAVGGRLSPTAGGPGVYPPLPAGVNVQLPNNDKELSWGAATDEEARRRSVYVFQRRSLTFPLFDVFDAAPMSQSCPARPETTVAPQALALLNGEFAREAARHLAERARREAGEDVERRIGRAFKLAFTREPTASELIVAKAFLSNQAEVRRSTGPADRADAAAFDDFCHVLLNANEFIYID